MHCAPSKKCPSWVLKSFCVTGFVYVEVLREKVTVILCAIHSDDKPSPAKDCLSLLGR